MTTPTLAGAVRRSVAERLREMNTSIPARVESFDSAARTITAQPLIEVAYKDETGARRTEKLAAIPHVPVAFPGSRSIRIEFPLVKGDTVLLMFCQASIDRWFARGGVVDPGDDRHHALSDAIAIPGVIDEPTAEGLDPVHATALVITAPEIHAGGTEQLATFADLQKVTDALAGAVPVALDGGAGLLTSFSTRLALDPPVGTSVLKGG